MKDTFLKFKELFIAVIVVTLLLLASTVGTGAVVAVLVVYGSFLILYCAITYIGLQSSDELIKKTINESESTNEEILEELSKGGTLYQINSVLGMLATSTGIFMATGSFFAFIVFFAFNVLKLTLENKIVERIKCNLN